MSINTLPSNSILNPRRLTPEPYVPAGNLSAPATYTRPVDWPALDVVTTSDHKMSGLYAVYNTSMEYVALTVTGVGTLTVDWGDGTSETLTTGVLKQHKYEYATLGTSVTSRGYKTALINVTSSTTINNINFTSKPVPDSPNNSLPTNWGPKWLDIAVGSGSLFGLTIGNATGAQVPNMLEQINIVNINGLYNPGTSQFQYCTALQSVVSFPLENIISNKTMNSMFMNCWNLVTAPNLDFTKCNDFFAMFENCYKLQSVPQINIATGTSTRRMFYNCTQLKTLPVLDYTNVTNANAMFQGCVSLQTLPTMNFSGSLTNTDSMFSGCQALKYAPAINTSNVTTTANMFSACTNLISVPLYNLQNATIVDTMFQNCVSLVNIAGPLNIAKASSLASFFVNCNSLINCPIFFNTTLVTNTGSMFSACYSLQNIPLFDTGNVTAATFMFQDCRALTSIPLFNFGKVISMSGMFQNCVSLVSIPLLNTINVTNFTNTFNSCRSLQNVANINTSNATTTNSMFTSCSSLVTAPSLDLTKVTDMTSMFQSCTSLQNANNLSNTSNVTNMTSTFNSCFALNEGPTLDTIKVTNITSLFSGCGALKSIPTYNTSNVLTGSLFLTGASAIREVPALNFSNVTTFTNPYSNANNIAKINTTGMKVTHTVATTSIGQTELQNYFANLASNVSTQTLTITSVPGATTAVAKTVNLSVGNKTVVMANTVGIVANMIVTGSTSLTNPVTMTFYTNPGGPLIVNSGGTDLDSLGNTRPVAFNTLPAGITTANLQIKTNYILIPYTSGNAWDYEVKTYPGNVSVVSTSTNATTGTLVYPTYVTTVNANANVVLSTAPQTTLTAQNCSFRALNTQIATNKGWTVTG